MNDYETLKAQNERANEYNRQLLERNSKLRKKIQEMSWYFIVLGIAWIILFIYII